MNRDHELLFQQIRDEIATLRRCIKRGQDLVRCTQSREIVGDAGAALWALTERLADLEYQLEPTPWPFVRNL